MKMYFVSPIVILTCCFVASLPVVRAEDAPVMPCETVGFHLRPCGFFDVSPCIDAPCSAEGCARARSKL